jgi:histidinol dehydrogenase
MLKQTIEKQVRQIVQAVARSGDAALFSFSKKFDGITLTADNIRATATEIKTAFNLVKKENPGFLSALKKAAVNICKYHEKQRAHGFTMKIGGAGRDAEIGLRVLPIERVGVYVPGGLAAYASSVLMNVIPAVVAGVKQLVLVSPPLKGVTPPQINKYILAAVSLLQKLAPKCKIEVYKIGGAQAVAALAYGTRSIPKADKIVGPGNRFVTQAKKEVFGVVGIDKLAGPSEVVVLADASANPEYIAAELLAQAEHDPTAQAVLVTDAKKLKEQVHTAVLSQTKKLSVRMPAKGKIKMLKAKNLQAAIDLANQIGPEHLVIMTKNPKAVMLKIENAGAIFLGEYSPVALGDYFAGPNHVLPTSGTARFSSPLGVWDFVKRQSVINYSAAALKKIAKDIATLAHAEGLAAHAEAVKRRSNR